MMLVLLSLSVVLIHQPHPLKYVRSQIITAVNMAAVYIN